jgi:hypothetical protein
MERRASLRHNGIDCQNSSGEMKHNMSPIRDEDLAPPDHTPLCPRAHKIVHGGREVGNIARDER